MGLKAKNYNIDEIGLILPDAYAVIRNLNVYGNKGTAEFAIQSSRENALNLQPLKIIYIEFEVNRNENPYITAYNLAKSVKTEKRGNHSVIHEMPFYGWEDDYSYTI